MMNQNFYTTMVSVRITLKDMLHTRYQNNFLDLIMHCSDKHA